MKPGSIIFNPILRLKVWVSFEGDRPVIARRCKTSNRMLYAIFFDSKAPVLQVPVPKGSFVTGKFYRESLVFKSLVCQSHLNRRVVWKRINRHLEKWVKMKSPSVEKPTR